MGGGGRRGGGLTGCPRTCQIGAAEKSATTRRQLRVTPLGLDKAVKGI